MKRLSIPRPARHCPVCGDQLAPDTEPHNRTCSRQCASILRDQILHPQRYHSRDMSPHALALAYVARRKHQRRAQETTHA